MGKYWDTFKEGFARGIEDRPLSRFDVATWADAMNNNTPGVSRSTKNSLQRLLEKRSPYRWARIQRDIRWLRGEMERLGLNPDDFRWVL